MVQIIDGRRLAASHEQRLKEKLGQLKIKPKVVSILIGNDPSSVMYTNIKQKKAEELGIDFEVLKFDVDSSFEEVSDKISALNVDEEINGLMIQLPIPELFLGEHNWQELPHMILSSKDIDGLTPNGPYLTATAKAVVSIISDEKIEVSGKRIVVIGKSDLVGKPIARELSVAGGIVEVIDRSTKDPAKVAAAADILISAVGQANLVKASWVKDGAVVIDVGTSEVNGKIVGDVDFEQVSKKASLITPSPGGVGPMTVVSLLENAVESVQKGLNLYGTR